MSLSLLLLLAIWALPCPMAHLPAAPAGIGVDLLLLLRRSLAAELAIATAAGGGYPGVPPSNPLLLCQQQLATVRRCCGLLHALVHRSQMDCHILSGEDGQVQHRLYGERDLDVLYRHGVEVLGDRLFFVDDDAVAPQLADERLQVEGEVLHRLTILELEGGILLLQQLGRRLLCAVGTDAHRCNGVPHLLSRVLRPQWIPILHWHSSDDSLQC